MAHHGPSSDHRERRSPQEETSRAQLDECPSTEDRERRWRAGRRAILMPLKAWMTPKWSPFPSPQDGSTGPRRPTFTASLGSIFALRREFPRNASGRRGPLLHSARGDPEVRSPPSGKSPRANLQRLVDRFLHPLHDRGRCPAGANTPCPSAIGQKPAKRLGNGRHIGSAARVAAGESKRPASVLPSRAGSPLPAR